MRRAAAERRLGHLDAAGEALEAAVREGAPLELAGGELAALLAADPGLEGARRALAAFAAVPPGESPAGPFPLAALARSASWAAAKSALFQAVFRDLGDEATLALGRSIAALARGAAERESSTADWPAALGRPVSDAACEILSGLHESLLAAVRRRITAPLDTPGPIREVASDRFVVVGPHLALALRGDEQAFVLCSGDRPSGPRLLLREQTLFAGQWLRREHEVLRPVEGPLASPRLVASSGGVFVLATAGGAVHGSFSAPGSPELARFRLEARGVAAACASAVSLAVFPTGPARAIGVATDGRVRLERPLGDGLEVIAAASADASGVFVLLLSRAERSEVDRPPSEAAFLLRLGGDLTPQGEPVPVPPLLDPRRARVEWPTPDLVLVFDGPAVAHAFGADDRRLAWTARISVPLEGLTAAAGGAVDPGWDPSGASDGSVELLAHGAIESEWGQPRGDLGLARWTRDGLGRHGPTVRFDAEPGSTVADYRLVARGSAVAVLLREPGEGGDEVTLRLLQLQPLEAKVPAAREWTFAVEPEE